MELATIALEVLPWRDYNEALMMTLGSLLGPSDDES
jgi:hypothetical protein